MNTPSTPSVVFNGIAIVFIALLVITGVLLLFPRIMAFFKKSKKDGKGRGVAASSSAINQATSPAPGADVAIESAAETVNEEVTVAVITAALMAYLGESRSNSGFRVKSFKRISSNNVPAWRLQGQ